MQAWRSLPWTRPSNWWDRRTLRRITQKLWDFTTSQTNVILQPSRTRYQAQQYMILWSFINFNWDLFCVNLISEKDGQNLWTCTYHLQGKITQDHKLRGRVERFLELKEQLNNREVSNFQRCWRYASHRHTLSTGASWIWLPFHATASCYKPSSITLK